MKKSITLLATILFSLPLIVEGNSQAKIEEVAINTLKAYGKATEIVKSVKAQNSKSLPLTTIKDMDKKWKRNAGLANYMKKLMSNSCGKYLTTLKKKHSYLNEIFVMDNQGANVAMTDKTTDYYQGDEAKFKKSFKKGKGQIFIDEVEFDDAKKTDMVEVSVPVVSSGKAIGAITFVVNVGKL